MSYSTEKQLRKKYPMLEISGIRRNTSSVFLNPLITHIPSHRQLFNTFMSNILPNDLLSNQNIRECVLIAASQPDHWLNERKRYTRTSMTCLTMFNLTVSSEYLKRNASIINAALLGYRIKNEQDITN